MEPENKQQKSIENEFERLGENLRTAVERAWQSDERKRLSRDLEAGIEELAEALNKTANEFIASPTGQKMRAELDELSQRVQEGEVTDKVEAEFVSVLERLNLKLEEVIASLAEGGDEQGGDEGS